MKTIGSLDYMHYRYYGSTMGRFLKPDNVDGNPRSPSWNMYAYVRGNPISFNDPTGHAWAVPKTSLQRTLQAGMFSYDEAISTLVGKSLDGLTLSQLLQLIRETYGVPDDINIVPINGLDAQSYENTIQLPRSAILEWAEGPTSVFGGGLVADLLFEWGNIRVGNSAAGNTTVGTSPPGKESFAYVWALKKAQSLGILGSPSSWELISECNYGHAPRGRFMGLRGWGPYLCTEKTDI